MLACLRQYAKQCLLNGGVAKKPDNVLSKTNICHPKRNTSIPPSGVLAHGMLYNSMLLYSAFADRRG